MTQIEVVPINFSRTFSLQNIGPYDPTASLTATRLRKAFFAENGPCVVEMSQAVNGATIVVQGTDNEQVRDILVRGLSRDDGYHSFSPKHPLVGKMHRQLPGLRLFPVPWIFDVACAVVLQQRIRFVDAAKSWRLISNKYGEITPTGLIAFPPARVVASMETWRFEELGVDGKRTKTLILMARELKRHPITADMAPAAARAILQRIPGVGPWTIDTILGYGLGDSDALPLGDLYLPHVVAYGLTGATRGSDEGMVQLLEPFRGQRFRVVRLLGEARIGPPRNYSPRIQK